MSDFAMAWCPDCRKWVPASEMHYFDGFRVCTWCMEGTVQLSGLVYDPHHEEVACVFCDSYDTIELSPNWGTYKCNACGEVFKNML